jgi:hypothetical protein
MRLLSIQLSCRLFFGKASHHWGLSAPLQSRFGSLRLMAFSKTKIASERKVICECDGHTVLKLSQRRLTADWLAPPYSDCSQMLTKVSSDWLPSYIKATWTILEIFKMAGYFPRSLCTHEFQPAFRHSRTRNLNTVSISTVVLFYGFVCMTETCVLLIPLVEHLMVKPLAPELLFF